MIYRRGQKVLVQGITGKQGSFWAAKMMERGTDVVAGVNPKRAGETHIGVPIFSSAVEANKHAPCDISVIFIPPNMAKDAIIDAIDAGIGTIVVLTEHIPGHDVLEIFARARGTKSRIIGPNTAGIVTPGEGFVGIMPGHNPNIFMPGRVGVISRSGSLGTLMCLNLTRAGLGQSAFIGIGGDPIIGTTFIDSIKLFNEDPDTHAIVMIGEIGGSAEESAADYIQKNVKKPVVGFIAGQTAPPGRRMGHAGAIISGGSGKASDKISAMKAAGIDMCASPAEIGERIKKHL